MIDAEKLVRENIIEDVDRRGRLLAKTYHVPFEDLLARYALSSDDNGVLVVQIRHAGHILDKVILGCGEWEK